MANYPAFDQERPSARERWRDPVEVDYSRAGGAKARRYQAAKKRTFTVEHRFLSNADRQTLETFYDANRATTFLFAWNDAPSTTFSVIFVDELEWSRDGANLWRVTAKLAEV